MNPMLQVLIAIAVLHYLKVPERAYAEFVKRPVLTTVIAAAALFIYVFL